MLIAVYLLGIAAVIVGAGAFFGAPYVPTLRGDLRRMFTSLRPVTSGDVVLDLGSGDGVVLIEAAKRGARAVGFELNPFFYIFSRLRTYRLKKQVQVKLTNMWTEPFPGDVTIVYAFSVRRDGTRLQKKMQREAARLNRPLELVCYGNAFKHLQPAREFEAYTLYVFQPLQQV